MKNTLNNLASTDKNIMLSLLTISALAIIDGFIALLNTQLTAIPVTALLTIYRIILNGTIVTFLIATMMYLATLIIKEKQEKRA